MNQAADAEIVQFDNVGLRYGTGKEVLTDISFTLFPGSFYFLTGASGAGKTSLLKLLYLAQRPSRGLIRMFGTDAITLPRERLPGFRRRLGVVFQDFRLVQHLSAYDNVALPLRVAGVPEREITGPVTDMLDWVGLADRQHARPATLSGGEQQRVAIARAVIGRPDMLVADEPTGNVDPDMAIKLMRLFEALNRLGTTVVVATHDVHLIRQMPESLIMRLLSVTGGHIEDGWGPSADEVDENGKPKWEKRPGDAPAKKPHGRLAWSIHLGRHGNLYLDVSVMPRRPR